MDRISCLHVYRRIVELGSFTAAAKDQRLRQATVSRWIADLESELGTRLFDRTTRVVRVTESGRLFYEHARQILDAWEQAVTSTRGTVARAIGRLRVSAPVVFGQQFITPNIGQFMSAHPGVELELNFSDRYVDLMEEGVDVALRVGMTADSNYQRRIISSGSRRLVASPRYMRGNSPIAHPNDLLKHCCLLHTEINNRETWTFTKKNSRTQVAAQGKFSSNSSASLRTVALQDQGVALLASWLVDQDITEGRLVHLLPTFDTPPARVHALFLGRLHQSRAIKVFLSFLDEILSVTKEESGPIDTMR